MAKTLTNHGGDIYSEGLLKGRTIIDFSSNINLLGVPESFNKVVEESLKMINCYPDIEYRETKKAITNYHLPRVGDNFQMQLNNHNIILGNGAAEVLDLAISTLKSICIIAPSFSEYKLSANKYGINIAYSYLTEDMDYNYEDIMEKMKSCGGLIIANPNNPNGSIINKDKFIPILNYCEANNKKIIIDEAFVEFVGDKYCSLLDLVNDYKCLTIVRAITKFFALPGIRLGWAISSNIEFLNSLKEKQLPWNINTFAAISLKHLLFDEEYIRKSLEANKEEKNFLYNKLSNCGVFEKVYKSHGNFLLCKLRNSTDEEIFQFSLDNGILIRKCGMYKGLDSSYIRLAVKSRENNEKLLEVLRKFK